MRLAITSKVEGICIWQLSNTPSSYIVTRADSLMNGGGMFKNVHNIVAYNDRILETAYGLSLWRDTVQHAT